MLVLFFSFILCIYYIIRFYFCQEIFLFFCGWLILLRPFVLSLYIYYYNKIFFKLQYTNYTNFGNDLCAIFLKKSLDKNCGAWYNGKFCPQPTPLAPTAGREKSSKKVRFPALFIISLYILQF